MGTLTYTAICQDELKTRTYSYAIQVGSGQITRVYVHRHGWWRSLQLHLLEGIGWIYGGLFDLLGERFEKQYINRLVKTDQLLLDTSETHVVEIPEHEWLVQETVKQIMLYYGVNANPNKQEQE